jgi:hypothetical protein
MVAKKKFSRTGKLRRSPRQPSLRQGRHQVNVLLGTELKNQIFDSALRNGRTFSAEAAVLLQFAITINRLLATMDVTVEQVAAKAALKNKGERISRD